MLASVRQLCVGFVQTRRSVDSIPSSAAVDMRAVGSFAPRACHVCRPRARPVRPHPRVDAVRAPVGGPRRRDLDGVDRDLARRPGAGEGAVSEASTGAFRSPRLPGALAAPTRCETRGGPTAIPTHGLAPIHPSVIVVVQPRDDVRFRPRRGARVDDTSQRWATFGTHRPEPLGHARIPQEISDRAPRPRTREHSRTPPSIPAMDPRPDSSFIVTLPQNTPRRTPSECAAP